MMKQMYQRSLRVPSLQRRLLVVSLFTLLGAGLAGCEGNEPPARPTAPAEEVFEALPSDSFIEEEIITPVPEEIPAWTPGPPDAAVAPDDDDDPAATGDQPGKTRRLPLSSPGAALPGSAPEQPVPAP